MKYQFHKNGSSKRRHPADLTEFCINTVIPCRVTYSAQIWAAWGSLLYHQINFDFHEESDELLIFLLYTNDVRYINKLIDSYINKYFYYDVSYKSYIIQYYAHKIKKVLYRITFHPYKLLEVNYYWEDIDSLNGICEEATYKNFLLMVN